jgi:hypothetical protein
LLGLTCVSIGQSYSFSFSSFSLMMCISTSTDLSVAQLVAFLPPSIAVFPQRDSMAVTDLEQQFQNLTTASGAKVARLYFNKGL